MMIMTIEKLLESWRKKLTFYKNATNVAKNMDALVEMGIKHSRIVTLEICIKELEQAIKE